MVRFLLLSIVLLMAGSIRAEYQVEMITANKRMIQDKMELDKTITTETRASDNIVAVHGKFNGTKGDISYNVHLILNKRFNDKDYKDILYLGDNSYLLLPIKKIDFVFGRKLFSSSPHFSSSWKDGMEGVGIETQLSKEFRFHAYLLDFYRGYPLFEKYFLFKNIQEDVQNGERFRHGLSLVYQKDDLYGKLQFTYLNLGNWGNGTKDDIRSQPKGDGDFIYTGIGSISNKNKYFLWGLELQFVRGLDKSQSNSVRKEKSIPISGELVRIYFESYLNFFRTKLEFFIPDSDKRNEQGEVLESGFVGFGTYPGNAFLLNQELNYYPSGWVTPSGLQKVDSVYMGRRNSFWTHLFFSVHLDDFFLSIQGDHLTPRSNLAFSDGNISFDKKDYSKSFLFELTGAVLYDRRPIDGYFVQLSFSKLYTSKDILLDGTSAFLQGGLVF